MSFRLPSAVELLSKELWMPWTLARDVEGRRPTAWVEISLAQLPPAAFDTVDVRHPNLVAARAALTP